MKRWMLSGILIIIADYFSKFFIKQNFLLNSSLPVIGNFFKITYVQNQGIAFGMFQESGGLFLFLTPAAILILSVIYYKSPVKSFFTKLAFTLIISGATGNYIDRIVYGFVIDFFDFDFFDVIINPFTVAGINFSGYYMTRWPAFNIADSAITTGVTILFLESVVLSLKKKDEKKAELSTLQI